MSNPELFTVPKVKSPRLRWIEKHRLVTQHHRGIAMGDEDPETGEDLYPWTAWKTGSKPAPWRSECGGATEDDALAGWARNNGVRMWFEEGMP